MNERRKILILGAGGLLGTYFLDRVPPAGWEIIGHNRRNISQANADLTCQFSTAKMLDAIQPDVILNLVALTDVEKCEKQPNEAYLTNVKSVESLVAWQVESRRDVHLIHISTDQVYDGPGPHSEECICLTNHYAASKYASEIAARQTNGTVIRTNFFGRSRRAGRTSFTDWLHDALSHDREITLFDDVYFSPVSMATLCDAIEAVINQNLRGLYNIGSKQGVSKAEFGHRFAEALGLPVAHIARGSVSAAEFLKTYRPRDMRMASERFELASGLVLPCLIDEILAVSKEYLQ